MNNKGQLFATDFLIAMTIIILGFGLIAALFEYNMYQSKEQTNYNELQEKTETVAITLANSSWSDCTLDGIEVAYSIGTHNLKNNPNASETTALKEKLGISNYKANIQLTGSKSWAILNDDLTTNKNITVTEVEVLWCTNGAKYSDLENCMETNLATCTNGKIGKGKLIVKVAK